jgi:hypothetical protein
MTIATATTVPKKLVSFVSLSNSFGFIDEEICVVLLPMAVPKDHPKKAAAMAPTTESFGRWKSEAHNKKHAKM